MLESYDDARLDSQTHSEVKSRSNMDTYDMFISSLRNRLKMKEKTQVDIAEEAGISKNYISLLVRGRKRASDEVRESIAGVFGVSLMEFINEGNLATEGKQIVHQPKPLSVSSSQTHATESRINPMDVLSSVSSTSAAISTLVGQYQKDLEQMRFWRSVFDALPVATLIIENGTVIYQNTRSSSIGIVAGKTICDNCSEAGCSDMCNDCNGRGNSDECACPVEQATNLKRAASGYLTIHGQKHPVAVAPLRIQDAAYYIVNIAEAIYDPNIERRNGDDRRQGGRLWQSTQQLKSRANGQ